MWVTEQNNTVYATYSPGSGDKKDKSAAPGFGYVPL